VESLLLLLGLLQARRPLPPSSSPVCVSVEVGGQEAPFYPARDGSGRLYFEARPGAAYSVRLRNVTGERVGVALDVDGLNVIDGLPPTGRGRLYILSPYGETLVRGWRSSLSEVHLFTFVDEAASYAARTGQSTRRLGWIEATVFREKAPIAVAEPESLRENSADKAAAAPPAPGAQASRSYPATGWGGTSEDHAVEVAFDAEAVAAQRVTLRYEYRSGLVALGVLPPLVDHLLERDRGFARPPLR